jgi:O-antigen/teichoic acid export membrane protein
MATDRIPTPIEMAAEESAVSESAAAATRSHLRGSSLLVAGNVISLGMNFVPHILLVRYLTMQSFGLWGYALSVEAVCRNLSIGLNEPMSRFVAIYHEKREPEKLLGTIVLTFSLTLFVACSMVAAFFIAPHQIAALLTKGREPVTLLLIIIFLVPLEAMDVLLMNLFACYGRARMIFIGKHILGPGLRVIVIGLVLLLHRGLYFLAYGSLVGQFFAIVVYCVVMVAQLKSDRLLVGMKLKKIKLPIREMFSYSAPLLVSNAITMIDTTAVVMFIGFFHEMTMVAAYRAVVPAASLNNVVAAAFASLYIPSATRLFAKNDGKGLNQMYWRTSAWIAMFTFPIFALTCCFARPVTSFLYGARYGGSAIILSMLALVFYFNVALGFNGLTLKIIGKVGYVARIAALAAGTGIVLNLLLIPKYGALGAAIATSCTFILHNIYKQVGLRLASGVSVFERRYVYFYGVIVGAALALFVIDRITNCNIYVAVGLVALATLGVLLLLKRELNISDTFPEIKKIPLVGKFLCAGEA